MLVVGVSFRSAGRLHAFDPAGLDLQPGERVVVEAERGAELGEVKQAAREVPDEQLAGPVPRVLRRATEADLAQEAANRELAERALALTRERIAARCLPMKPLRAEYTLDRSRVTIFFRAEGRVDFRELVKDLAARLRTRIQLHQVGARDAAKLLGGIGPCGRGLCCATWLTEFQPISMKMAKEQSLFLNPTKFSGVCGKLMCCLRYEYDLYREARARLPQPGAEVQTPDGRGRVVEQHVLAGTVRVLLSDGREREYPADAVYRPVVRGCAVLSGGACTGGCAARREETGPPSDAA